MSQEENDLRRAAYRAALIRLAKAWPQPYKQFRAGVEILHPGWSSWKTTSEARRLLREAFRHRFDQVYAEEKIKRGLLPGVHRGRNWDEAAAKIVELYDNGNGLSMKEIRAKLNIGTEFVSQSIRDAGITPKPGRRK